MMKKNSLFFLSLLMATGTLSACTICAPTQAPTATPLPTATPTLPAYFQEERPYAETVLDAPAVYDMPEY
ncbi:MAG: hypothetical protein KIG36_01250, partial [Eubacteriales bacterium]|nr:hypothetical protein [Eubacteriales bacterium]